MSFIGLHFQGRWGNQLFEYAFARGFAERNGLTLHTDPWVGQKIFQIDDPPIVMHHVRCNRDENNIRDGDKDFTFVSYCQNQKCADYYSVMKIREWFKFRPEIVEKLNNVVPIVPSILAHRRNGDYKGSGFPVISEIAYLRACDKYGMNSEALKFVTEETQIIHPDFKNGLEFLPDFFRLMCAEALFRGNSTFSWWAGALGLGKVYAPVIKGLLGGVEHDDVPFVEGNYPACCDLSFVSDIHLKP